MKPNWLLGTIVISVMKKDDKSSFCLVCFLSEVTVEWNNLLMESKTSDLYQICAQVQWGQQKWLLNID